MKQLKIMMLFVFLACGTTDIAFFAAKKLQVIDDYVYIKRFPSRRIESTPIVLVAIDEDTVSKLGTLPYKRSLYGEVIAKILEGRPKVIGMDIFLYYMREEKDDLKLLRILEKAKSDIVLAVYEDEVDAFLLYEAASRSLYKANEHIVPANIRISYISSYGVITKASLLPVVDKQDREYHPFPIAVVSKYYGIGYEPYTGWDARFAAVGGRQIPALHDTIFDSSMLINYTGGIEAFETISFEKVLETDPGVFKDKIVLIGATSPYLGDMVVTPLSDSTPGVLVLANAISTIVNWQFIRTVESPYQWGIIFALSFLVACALFFTNGIMGFLITLCTIGGFKVVTDVYFYVDCMYITFTPILYSLLVVPFGVGLVSVGYHD